MLISDLQNILDFDKEVTGENDLKWLRLQGR